MPPMVQEMLVEAVAELKRKRTPTRVPDYFCCQITMEIMLDPVTTPCGITYERNILVDHLRKVGKFDPVTRKPLDVHQLSPNLALKEAISDFLEANPWAYECNM
mmetsp:Transcript_18703/g.44831  ORF Transcript_18703/g.44831 Transcript_18703/m.44831 type:complete len:104 (+) Transcript_18703:559-870(+)